MPKSIIAARQTTLRREIELAGKGVHSGAPASVVLHPADSDTGLRFLVSKRGRIIADIPADVRNVKNLTLCTVLGDEYGVSIGTVEHLLSALRGLGVDNCYIEVDSKEVPIMDGSAAEFVAAIDEVGLRELSETRRYIKVLRPVRVEEGESWGELVPHGTCHFDVEIDFNSPLIGRQRLSLDLTPASYRTDLSRARTFGFMRDVEKLWKAGLALGASLDNTVAVGDDRILNAEGLRYHHEFVRHKMLDAVGDLSLAGYHILGSYRSVRGGHRLNAHVVKALLNDASAWTLVHAPVSAASRVLRDVSGYRPMGLALAAGE